jgi:endonuclease YncB( thermonuclease family)
VSRRLLVAALLLGAVWGTVAARKWEPLDRCRLVPSIANDGDSFLVKHEGQVRKFRLYFCDTPETWTEEAWARKRVAQQAEYWSISAGRAVEIGEAATEFTRRLLSKDPFTVFTRGDDARGSGMPRHYALVRLKDGSWLSARLVEQGLARRYTRPPELRAGELLPGGRTVREMQRTLERLEQEARRAARGGWSD